MTKNAAALPPIWDDANSRDEDTPAWTDDQLDRAELAVGGKVVRPANGTLYASRGDHRSAMRPSSR